MCLNIREKKFDQTQAHCLLENRIKNESSSELFQILKIFKFRFLTSMMEKINTEKMKTIPRLYSFQIYFFSLVYPMGTLTLLRADFLTPIQLSVWSECYL